MQKNVVAIMDEKITWKAGNVSRGGGDIKTLPSDYRELLFYATSSTSNNYSFQLPYEVVSAFSDNMVFSLKGVSSGLINVLVNPTVFALMAAIEPDGTDTSATAEVRLYYR